MPLFWTMKQMVKLTNFLWTDCPCPCWRCTQKKKYSALERKQHPRVILHMKIYVHMFFFFITWPFLYHIDMCLTCFLGIHLTNYGFGKKSTAKVAAIWDCSIPVQAVVPLYTASPVLSYIRHTQISDESPSSHHHWGTRTHIYTQTCSTFTHTQTHLHSDAVCAQERMGENKLVQCNIFKMQMQDSMRHVKMWYVSRV